MTEKALKARIDLTRPMVPHDDGSVSMPVIVRYEDGTEEESYATVDGQTLLQMERVHEFNRIHNTGARSKN